jgi:hypothetical protein
MFSMAMWMAALVRRAGSWSVTSTAFNTLEHQPRRKSWPWKGTIKVIRTARADPVRNPRTMTRSA